MVDRHQFGLPAFTNRWQSGVVDVSDGELAFHRTGGEGPAIVFCHGLTDNGLCWARTAQALENDFDIVMLDARGHGESSRLSHSGTHNPARDIAEAIAILGLTTPILIGHSIGAHAVAAYASENPHLVSKLVLEDPPLLANMSSSAVKIGLDKFRAQIETLRSMPIGEIIKIGQLQSPTWHVDDFATWALSKQQVDPHALQFQDVVWEPAFAKIGNPTLLIHGEGQLGAMVSTEVAANISQVNTLIRTLQIKGAGHNVRRENFDSYINVVRAFVLGEAQTSNNREVQHDGR